MQDIAELERRITAAMERITKGLDRLAGAEPAGDAAEIARLGEALDEERMTNAQLNERIRVLRDRLGGGADATEAQMAELTSRLAAQDEELSTLRRVLGEAGKEIAALRAARASDAAELADITAALDPLLTEARHAGA
jgi:chromosome segregation ATPase